DVTGDAPADRDIAFVFQQYSLYPHLSVFENMAFALRAPIRRIPEAEIRAKVREVARLLHIETKLENKATQLSGGQMQRVAIGRLPAALFAGAPVGARTVGARTEHLTIARGGGDVQATVKRIEHLGDQSHLHLDLGGQSVVTLSDPEAGLGAGDIISLRLNKP